MVKKISRESQPQPIAPSGKTKTKADKAAEAAKAEMISTSSKVEGLVATTGIRPAEHTITTKLTDREAKLSAKETGKISNEFFSGAKPKKR